MNTKVDECKLISGKEAKLAWANGRDVQFRPKSLGVTWGDLSGRCFLDIFDQVISYEFRLKPNTITINGIEVPAPFEPKMNQKYFYLYTENMSGYANDYYGENIITKMRVQLGAWRTEEEIKQVVAVLRQVFGDSHD